MTDREARILYALAWMAEQYIRADDGTLDHQCMSAGEQAIRVLADYELVADDGRNSRWTEKGQQLLDRRF